MRRGIGNWYPARLAKCAVRHTRDMREKCSCFGRNHTDPIACEIEPAAIVSCNAVEMRDGDPDAAVPKVVRCPVGGHLCRRIPIHKVAVIDSAGVCFAVSARDRIVRSSVVPNSVGGNAYRSGFFQLNPGLVVDVVNERPSSRKVCIKVADDKAAHCAMGDRVKNCLSYRGIIECLPRTGAVWWSFVEQ